MPVIARLASWLRGRSGWLRQRPTPCSLHVAALEDALLALPPAEQRVFRLHLRQGLTVAQIADHLDLPAREAEALLVAALVRFAGSLESARHRSSGVDEDAREQFDAGPAEPD